MSGLTLVELMLVVAIIGVLVAIALPKYNSYSDRVNQYQAINDIRILQTLIKQYANDNNGTYPTSLAAVGGAGKLDPWGRAYVYQELASGTNHGASRRDHNVNPINSDFDLCSMGKDGQTKKQLPADISQDDIIRARDGAYIGLVSDFVP
jgi:general secretion pathway protein G